MKIIIITCTLVIILGILLIILINSYNKFQWYIIKINKAKQNIHSSLINKYDVLIRYLDFLKENTTIDEEDFEEYLLLNRELPLQELNIKINNMHNLIKKYMDNNEKLLKKETINKIEEELSYINISINSSKKYYNDNVIPYNHLCHSIPSNIIAKIFKYQNLEFIDEDKEEKLKILEEEK